MLFLFPTEQWAGQKNKNNFLTPEGEGRGREEGGGEGRGEEGGPNSAKWWFSSRLIWFVLGAPGIPDPVKELCPPQDTAEKLREVIEQGA